MGESREMRGSILAAQAGDEAAFAVLVVRFRATALIVARQTCGDSDLAEDAVQDAFVTAFRALTNLDDPDRFGPWFATIVRNRARRLAKEGSRRRGLPLHALDREFLARNPLPTPPLPTPAEEAVRALPDGIRESMVLHYFEEWSAGEIAALLERPITTVKWQLHAGRALLRRRLAPSQEIP